MRCHNNRISGLEGAIVLLIRMLRRGSYASLVNNPPIGVFSQLFARVCPAGVISTLSYNLCPLGGRSSDLGNSLKSESRPWADSFLAEALIEWFENLFPVCVTVVDSS